MQYSAFGPVDVTVTAGDQFKRETYRSVPGFEICICPVDFIGRDCSACAAGYSGSNCSTDSCVEDKFQRRGKRLAPFAILALPVPRERPPCSHGRMKPPPSRKVYPPTRPARHYIPSLSFSATNGQPEILPCLNPSLFVGAPSSEATVSDEASTPAKSFAFSRPTWRSTANKCRGV